MYTNVDDLAKACLKPIIYSVLLRIQILVTYIDNKQNEKHPCFINSYLTTFNLYQFKPFATRKDDLKGHDIRCKKWCTSLNLPMFVFKSDNGRDSVHNTADMATDELCSLKEDALNSFCFSRK